jgi:histone acetyltransferase MYST1
MYFLTVFRVHLGLGEIIEARADPSDEKKQQYYVHYCNYDKRLDAWMGPERFLSPKEAEAYRLASEEQGKQSAASSIASGASEPNFGGGATEKTLTRALRRRFQEQKQAQSSAPSQNASLASQSSAQLLALPSQQVHFSRPVYDDPVIEQLEREHEAATKVKNIQKIELGRYEIDCWYFSPFPDAYAKADKLYFCEGCLKYMRFVKTLVDHRRTCKHRNPPGMLIYRKDNLEVYELDGEVDKLYCQNICLTAKLFLDHKTLYYDVSPFHFYVLCEVDEEGTHPVGYFSKEKASPDDYNLACIMILPPHQRKGYGRFLIQLSYEISRRENKTGSPEKPLSDLGLVSYRSFWTLEILMRLKRAASQSRILTIDDLVDITAFKREDVIDTLARLNLLTVWRGQPTLNYSARVVDEHMTAFAGKKFTVVDPKALSWPSAYAPPKVRPKK